MKSHSREWLFCLALALLLAGCTGGPEVVGLEGPTMGTTWHASYVVPPGGADPAAIREGIQARLDSIEAAMSTYRDDSEISRFNRAGPDEQVKLSADFARVLAMALEVGEHSGGAYDVTVAPLVNLWGFGPGDPVIEPPAQEAIAAVLSRVGQHLVEFDPALPGALKRGPVSLDFSSLAKGFAVDGAASWLQEQGVARFLLEVGGEVKVSGLSGRGDLWRVAIEDPAGGGRAVAATVSVTDAAVATSGDYRNFFAFAGRRYSHTIDPRSGHPVAHDLVSVTVVHSSAMFADAWATALTVLGGDEAMAVAQDRGLAVYFIRRSGDSFAHSHSPAFSVYLAHAVGATAPGENE